MLKGALTGIGRLGRLHFKNLNMLSELRKDFEFVAVCDIDEAKLSGAHFARSNVDSGDQKAFDMSRYHLYTDFDEMLEKEDLDFVVLAVPTDLHAPFAVKAMEKGLNVFSEKPMAHNIEWATKMVEAQKRTGKKLMVGQCLRFWREYLYLKQVVESGVYGKVNSAHFWRGGYQDHVANPSYQGWILKKERGGGGLYDQHVHDADLILWLFGFPNGVFTQGKTVFEGSADDVMLTTYLYPGMVITARDDTACKGFPFSYGYEVGLELATLYFSNGKLQVWEEHKEPFSPDLSGLTKFQSAYESELDYFIDAQINDTEIARATGEQARDTIRLIEAEAKSSALTQIVTID